MASLIDKRVSTDQQSVARQNLVLDEAGIEDRFAFEEAAGPSRLHPCSARSSVNCLPAPGGRHRADLRDVPPLSRHPVPSRRPACDRLALRIHDGEFSAVDLTARHPRTGELPSTVKFIVQALASFGELQGELTYDGLRAAEA